MVAERLRLASNDIVRYVSARTIALYAVTRVVGCTAETQMNRSGEKVRSSHGFYEGLTSCKIETPIL